MLLRYENGKLYLLESTNGDGVGATELNENNIREYQLCYKRMVYRRLKVKRTDEFIDKLQCFLNVTLKLTLESKRKKI